MYQYNGETLILQTYAGWATSKIFSTLVRGQGWGQVYLGPGKRGRKISRGGKYHISLTMLDVSS